MKRIIINPLLNKSNHLKHGISFAILLLICFLIIYFTESIVKPIFFILLLILFYRSANNYYWLVLFFVINLDIGGFFYGNSRSIFVIGSAPIPFLTIFAITSFLKAVFKLKKRGHFLFKKPMIVWLIYLIFLLLSGSILFGLGGGGKTGYRWLYAISVMITVGSLFYSLPILMNKKDETLKFANLIFICVFINIVGQFIHLYLGHPVSEILNPKGFLLEVDLDDKLLRPIWGVWTNLLGLMLATYYFIQGRSNFKSSYLVMVMFVGFISILIHGTRGYFLGFSIFLLLVIFRFGSSQLRKISSIIIFSITLFFVLFTSWPGFREQVLKSTERLLTIEAVFEGDLTAGGTNVRTTDRNDNVMAIFQKSPLIGVGFSDEALENNDQHVGNQNILMSGGLIGFAVIIYFLGYVSYIILKANRISKRNASYKGELIVFIFFLFSLVIIHSTSTALFGYGIYVRAYGSMTFVAFALSLINNILLLKE